VEVCAEREGKEGWAEGGCGFNSLIKQKIKGKNCAVIYIAGKRFFFIYEVITWGKKKALLITTAPSLQSSGQLTNG
jgi:hypothetical protein